MPGTLRVSILKLSCGVGAVQSPHVSISLGLQTVKTPIPEVEGDAAAVPKGAGSDKVYHNLPLGGPRDRFSMSVISSDGSKFGIARIALDEGSPSLLEQAYSEEDRALKLGVEVMDDAGSQVGFLSISLQYVLAGEEEGHVKKGIKEGFLSFIDVLTKIPM